VSAVFAFLHHLAAFALVGALAAEFALIRGELDARTALRILIADAIYGASAGMVVVVGLLRVFFFEKGAAYYLHSVPFLLKFTLVVAAGSISIYPTIVFMSWRKAIKRGEAPAVDERKRRLLQQIIHFEFMIVAGILLCAALMARGVGYFG
jgi:putative membrane protein